MRREPRSCAGAFAGMAMRSAILKGVTKPTTQGSSWKFQGRCTDRLAMHSILLERVTRGKPGNGHQQPLDLSARCGGIARRYMAKLGSGTWTRTRILSSKG